MRVKLQLKLKNISVFWQAQIPEKNLTYFLYEFKNF